jgi:hypothetical protein
MSNKNVWILPWLMDSKHRALRNAGFSKEGHYEFAFSGVHNVLQDF